MVMVLETKMIEEIAQIGRLRAPAEACGLLLPVPIRGRSVWEIPNRSKTPQDSFEMTGEDMVIVLESLFDGNVPKSIVDGLTAWHTHPGGNLGPSTYDLYHKPLYIRSLVVTLFNDGTPAKATWY
jgi:proteasome lid subunit RPN8/RPN11